MIQCWANTHKNLHPAIEDDVEYVASCLVKDILGTWLVYAKKLRTESPEKLYEKRFYNCLAGQYERIQFEDLIGNVEEALVGGFERGRTWRDFRPWDMKRQTWDFSFLVPCQH